MTEPEEPFGQAVVVEITDTLDLHHFRPAEAADLVGEWLEECHRRGLREVRIIHGRGSGQLRRLVQAALARHRLVAEFRTEPANPGATLARLKDGPSPDSV
jgi:DNA-nicking Smr family endonuclease